MAHEGRRAERVAELLRGHVVELLRDMGDPRLENLVITNVEIGDDLSYAKLRVRALIGGDDAKAQKAMIRALERATPRLRRALGPRLALRRIPELHFEADVGHDASRRVEELLREIAKERPPEGSGSGTGGESGTGGSGSEGGAGGAGTG